MRPLGLAALLLSSSLAFGQPAATVAITIDAAAPAHPFPHFWERMFGSGRANLSLREGYRNDLRTVRQATDFQFIRFHGIFDDENGVFGRDAQGRAVYNWTYVDQIYDGLLDNHVRPFVELGFMPAKLAASTKPHAFWYKPIPNPPADYGEWGALIENFARHLVARYGIDEVSTWPFEVWNEPNLDFWTGEPRQAAYYRLYAGAAQALKRVSPRLRVGGPATAQAAWVGQFIDYCVAHNLPFDFVSTHVYGNDSAEDVFGTHEKIDRKVMVARAIGKVHDEIQHSARPGTPLYWSEFNASYMNEVPVTDSPYIGPWLANTIRLCDGLVDMLSYWSFSDVFEEQGVARRPFYGGYGLVATGNIPKAALNDFRLLHELGDQRIANDSEDVLVTRRADGSLAVALWNYAAPEEKGADREFRLSFQRLNGANLAHIQVVDESHGNALAAWEAMGRPDFPTRDEQRRLVQAALLPAPTVQPLDGRGTLTLVLRPKALALIELSK